MSASDTEHTDGPNFNDAPRGARTACSTRSATAASPGAIMPENIVTGEDAREVAEFLAKYAGRDAGDSPPTRDG